MKKTLIIATAALIAVACTAVGFSKFYAEENTAVSIMFDSTDSLKAKVDTAQFYSLLKIDAKKWAGYQVDINTFSNFDFNPSQSCRIDAEYYFLSNPGQREKEVLNFKQSILGKITTVQEGKKGLPKSSIYGPMIRDLNRLAKSTAGRKYALYFTDGRENSDLFSTYSKEGERLILENPKKIKELLLSAAKPTNLSGIKVFLICEPGSDKENRLFIIMSSIFKEILVEAGATVFVGADLNISEDQ